MVWNSTQSALYRAVDSHNDGFSESGKREEKKAAASSQKHAEKEARKSVKTETEKRCENCPKNRADNAPSDPISRILSDRDMLLIAGLIFILMRENADKKLILALAIVLLG